jgi:hypothetical protein
VDQYRHNAGKDTADARMKRQILGREVVAAGKSVDKNYRGIT